MKNNSFDKLDYFKVLEISPDSSEDVLRQKYHDLAKFWHPDRNTDPKAIDMFQKISIAYEILKDEEKRLKYILLSMIYDASNFPNIDSLAVLRNLHGQYDLNLRAFHLIEVTGKGIHHTSVDKIYYCNPFEAANVVKSITKHNWLYGFWGVTAFFANIHAILHNISNINNPKDNLFLLLHNSLAYRLEGKNQEALILALSAKEYASKSEKFYIDKYINLLQTSPLTPVKKWNFSYFVRMQLLYPIVLFLICFFAFSLCKIYILRNTPSDGPNVKQVVVFNTGQKSFSDVAVAKIVNIPVDIYDTDRLYHVTQRTNAMHGADKSFDIFKTIEEGTTIRITGYTTDKNWYRVMLDSGDMAFIEASKLQKGIGKPIPLWSKIYKEN